MTKLSCEELAKKRFDIKLRVLLAMLGLLATCWIIYGVVIFCYETIKAYKAYSPQAIEGQQQPSDDPQAIQGQQQPSDDPQAIQGQQQPSDDPQAIQGQQQPQVEQKNYPNGIPTADVVSCKYIDECAICLGKFVDGELCKVFTNCKHLYHQSCIDPWLRGHTNCPICRDSASTHQNTGTT